MSEYHSRVMARSLKTKYLLVALAVGAALSLLMVGLEYYEHRVDTADVNQVTNSTVEQKLETDLEARAVAFHLIQYPLARGANAVIG